MMNLEVLTNEILNGYRITKEEAMLLVELPLNEVTFQANRIRKHFCSDNFDACTIINVKSGKCIEDCKFCAQSIHYPTKIKEYPLLTREKLIEQTQKIYDYGLKRISYVASGRTITQNEFQTIKESIIQLKNENKDIKICVSLGLLTENQIKTLEKIGVDRIHNNIETSKKYFQNVCTTHSYNEKIETLEKISNKNIKICSGGIFGLGEDYEDRIDQALELRKYNVMSIPINILHPIPGTPLENNKILTNDEVCRIIAIYRFINPKAYIRLAGGRLQLSDNGKKALQSGANAAILGNMLTTRGVEIKEDMMMLKELGYNIIYDI